MEADFIGKDALIRIAQKGVSRKQVGIEIKGDRLEDVNNEFWHIFQKTECIGHVTSAIYSPRLKKNIALAMVQIDHSHIGLQAEVHTPFGSRKIEIVEKPFYDPNKNLAVRGKVVGTKNSFS